MTSLAIWVISRCVELDVFSLVCVQPKSDKYFTVVYFGLLPEKYSIDFELLDEHNNFYVEIIE